MRRLAFLAVVIFAFCTHSRNLRSAEDPVPLYYRDLLRNAYATFAAGKPTEALRLYHQVYDEASRGQQYKAANKALTAAAGCEMALLHYRTALEMLYVSRADAEAHNDCALLAAIEGNISSIKVEMGDFVGALPGAERAVQMRSCMPSRLNRAQTLLHLGRLQSLQNNRPAAIDLARMALDEVGSETEPAAKNSGADPTDDVGARQRRSLSATALDRIGVELLHDDLAASERVLATSYRYRLLDRAPDLYLSRYQLAKLKLLQRDYPFALHLINSAIATSPGTRLPSHLLYHLRGRIRVAAGDLAGSLEDFRQAVRLAAGWRSGIAHSEAFRTATDVSLQEIYDSFIETAAELHLRSNHPALVIEAWQAAEANRAASLREGLLTPRPVGKADREYLDVLDRLRLAEARSFAGFRTRPNELGDLRLALNEIEARSGASLPKATPVQVEIAPGISLNALRSHLGSDGAFISFHLGKEASFRWTVTHDQVRIGRLPSASHIESLAARFRDSVETGKSTAASLGHDLYRELFDEAREDILPVNLWLALEGSLTRIPLAALVSSFSNNRPEYLIERHSLEVVPGAWALGKSIPPAAGIFLGIGDPIYNRADSRYDKESAPRTGSIFNWTRGSSRSNELPRLVGSGREVELCARLNPAGARILSGANVRRERLIQAIESGPAVLHMATHFIPSLEAADQSLVVLSLQPSTQVYDMLTSSDVARLSLPGSLVVLSGCSSAAGRSLPGAGLLGLTRAFLSAGASSVIASHWATPDDSGELFASFYGHLRTPHTGPAKALRAAQLEMIHASTWRSNPQYWAAFQLTGRSNVQP